MVRNKILLIRRKISSSCKFLNRLPHRMSFRVQNSPRSGLNRVVICEVALVVAVFILLYLTAEKKTSATQNMAAINHVYEELLRTYGLWKIKFLAMLEVNEINSLEAYQNMVKNSLNSQKILQIIEEESTDVADLDDRQCVIFKSDCPRFPPNLQGKLKVKDWIVQVRKKKLRERRNYTYPRHPGVWSPLHCTSRHSVAIIIPYRNRELQLNLLLQHLPPILQRQEISYKIFVVEQVGGKTFNKGILMNTGFMIALNRLANGVPYHCIIFQDVDLLAEDDRNMYTCPEFPRHMSSGVDELDYDLPYPELVGGVFAIRTDQFIEVNGYSNLYWGWGGEDDDMGLRVEKAFRLIMRPPGELGRFSTIPHIKQTPFLSVRIRRDLIKTAQHRYRSDGLSTVKFKLTRIIRKRQFTHVFIDVGNPPKDYRALINPGHAHLRRTLMQQLMKTLEKWPLRKFRTPLRVLPGEVPDPASFQF